MTVNTETGESVGRPEVPLQIITPTDVRASIRRARASLEKAASEIVWQVEREAWRTLGYTSWTAMREAEYGDAAFMVPAKNRFELVARMRSAGESPESIAKTAGVSRRTVFEDFKSESAATHFENHPPPPITNSRGQQRPATYARTDDDDEVIDAEVIEDDEPVSFDPSTGEVLDAPNATDPAPAESATAVTCPTCHGTGKVTR